MIIDTLTVPDMPWINEYSWHSRAANAQYASSGALIVEVAQRQVGRPIVLQDDMLTRATVNALVAHAEATPGEFGIKLGDGREFTVMWDFAAGPISAEPLQNETDPDSTSLLMGVTLRFMTI